MDCAAVSLAVDSTGCDYWVFSGDSGHCCEIQQTALGGKHLISKRNYSEHQSIISELSMCNVPYGENSNRICFNCLKFGHTKVKTPEGATNFYFCCHECLEQSSLFVDSCGPVCFIDGESSSSSDSICLALKMLFLRKISADGDNMLERVLQHERHLDIPLSNIERYSQQIYSDMSTSPNPISLLQDGESCQLVENLLRVVQFNSQAFAVPDLPKAGYRCMFNTLSRVNHSCSPNCILAYSIQSEGDILGSLIAIRPIRSDEDLTISYLSQPCSSLVDRRTILQESFHFTCTCVKCQVEEDALPPSRHTAVPDQTAGGKRSEGGLDPQYLLKMREEVQAGRNASDRLQQVARRTDQLEKGMDMLRSRFSSNKKKSVVSSYTTCKVDVAALCYVYAIHDVAALLVEGLTATRAAKSSRAQTSAVVEMLSNTESAVMTVRLCKVLYECWDLSGSYCKLFSQVNILLMAGAAASRLVNAAMMSRNRVSSHGSGVDVSEAALLAMITNGKDLLRVAVAALEMYSENCERTSSGRNCVINPYSNIRNRAVKLLEVLS